MPYSLMIDFLPKYDEIWSQRQREVNRVTGPMFTCSPYSNPLWPQYPIRREKVACGSFREALDHVILTLHCKLQEGRYTVWCLFGADEDFPPNIMSSVMKTIQSLTCELLCFTGTSIHGTLRPHTLSDLERG